MARSGFPVDGSVGEWPDFRATSPSSPPDPIATRSLTEQVALCFQKYRLPVYRYLRYACRNVAEAEEITQDAFLRLYRVMERGETVDDPRKWLFAVARNLVIDRSRRRRPAYITPVLQRVWRQLADTVPDGAPSSEALLVQKSRAAELEAAMSCLTGLQRQCIHLRSEGLLYREIANVLGISVQSVADAIQRGVAKLRLRLGE